MRANEVIVPSDMIVLGDGNIGYINVAGEAAGLVPPLDGYKGGTPVVGFGSLNKLQCGRGKWPASDLRAERAIAKRHQGSYNVAFADGHAEFISHQKLYDGSDSSLRRWNRNHEPHR